ncbi:hypothetical protein JCM11491_001817 [Sporobolomyces phaffii]
MPFQTWIHEVSGKILMSILSLVVGPLVVFAYKYQRGAKLSHWLLWVLLVSALTSTWLALPTGIGGFDPLWSWGRQAINGQYNWGRISIQSAIPYCANIVLALFMVWEREITGHASNGQGGGAGGIGGSGMDDQRGDGGFSLSKGQRHFEKVANARAKAARQLKRQYREDV